MISFKLLLEQLRNPKEIGLFKSATSHIKSVDSRDQSWQGTLPELFSKFGFHEVGSGKYGTVFIKDDYPYVIKVFMRDTAYLKWLNFCKQNPNNKYVPKIRGKVVKIGPTFMAVRLEKLTPYKGTYNDPSEEIFKYKNDEDAKQVADFLDKNAKLLDIHRGNVMSRGNQTVIIDPFYNWYKGGKLTIDPDDLSEFKDIL